MVKEKYILLDVNGTIGTDAFGNLLKRLEKPQNYVWVEKVSALVKLHILKRIEKLSKEYNATVLWSSFRGRDALVLNSYIDSDWDWLDVVSDANNSNYKWLKTESIAKFVNEHPDSLVIVCDDMLRKEDIYTELKEQAPSIHIIAPSHEVGLKTSDLQELETILTEADN